MAAQLDLDLESKARRDPASVPSRRRLAAHLRALLRWTPLWVTVVFLGQLIVIGWLPARAEAARLDQAEAEMDERVGHLEQRRQELDNEARMLGDEIFQERVRRSLLDPAAEPLTLERARNAAKP